MHFQKDKGTDGWDIFVARFQNVVKNRRGRLLQQWINILGWEMGVKGISACTMQLHY